METFVLVCSTVPSAMDTVAISKNVYQPLPQDNLKAKT